MRSFDQDIEFVYCKNGAPFEPSSEASRAHYAEASRKILAKWNDDAREDARVFSRAQLEKPDWFRSAERSARQFVRSLGLEGCKGAQVSLVDVSSAEVEAASHIDGHWDAFTTAHLGVVVRDEAVRKVRQQSGQVGVGQLMCTN